MWWKTLVLGTGDWGLGTGKPCGVSTSLSHQVYLSPQVLESPDTKCFVESHQYLQPGPPDDSLCIGYMKHPLEMLTIFVGNSSLTAKMESKDLWNYHWGCPFIGDSFDQELNCGYPFIHEGLAQPSQSHL